MTLDVSRHRLECCLDYEGRGTQHSIPEAHLRVTERLTLEKYVHKRVQHQRQQRGKDSLQYEQGMRSEASKCRCSWRVADNDALSRA